MKQCLFIVLENAENLNSRILTTSNDEIMLSNYALYVVVKHLLKIRFIKNKNQVEY